MKSVSRIYGSMDHLNCMMALMTMNSKTLSLRFSKNILASRLLETTRVGWENRPLIKPVQVPAKLVSDKAAVLKNRKTLISLKTGFSITEDLSFSKRLVRKKHGENESSAHYNTKQARIVWNMIEDVE